MKPERLTRHFDESKQESLELYDLRDIGLELRKNEKLSKLEDIEEKAGASFIVFYKAFTQGIWVKSNGWDCSLENEPKFIPPEQLELGRETYYEYGVGDKRFTLIYKEANALCFYTHNYEDTENVVRIKDYGKMYALTKEELE